MHIVRNSGHDYNDFGRYRDCQNKHQMNYYLVSVLEKFPVPMAFGLCLPQECSLQDVEGFKPNLLNGIRSVIPNVLEDVKGFDRIDSRITFEDLRIVQPSIENAQTTKFTSGSVLTLLIMTFFVVTGFVSTCYIWKQSKDEIHLDDINSQSSPVSDRLMS